MPEPALAAVSGRAKLSKTLSVEVFYGKSIRSFQVVEKVEQVNEEVSEKDNEQVS
jgi:hypothetical protein